MRIVVRELALDGADGGADPIVEGALALVFRWVMGVGRGGRRWGPLRVERLRYRA